MPPENEYVEVGAGWDALYPEDLIDPFGSVVAKFQQGLDHIYEMEGSPSIKEIEDALQKACPKLSLETGVCIAQLGADGGCVRLLTALGASCYGSDFDTGSCGTSGATYEVSATTEQLADWTATLKQGIKLLRTLPDGSVCAAVGDTGDVPQLKWHHCSVIGDVLSLLAETENLQPKDQDWEKIFGELLLLWDSYLDTDSQFPPWSYFELISQLEGFPGIRVTVAEEPKVDFPGRSFLDIEVHIDIKSFDGIEKKFTAFRSALKSYPPLQS